MHKPELARALHQEGKLLIEATPLMAESLFAKGQVQEKTVTVRSEMADELSY